MLAGPGRPTWADTRRPSDSVDAHGTLRLVLPPAKMMGSVAAVDDRGPREWRQAIVRDAIAQQPLELDRREELWEPGWEPSVADVRPHRARSSVRPMHLTTYWATVSDVGPQGGSPSHRGSQRFDVPNTCQSFRPPRSLRDGQTHDLSAPVATLPLPLRPHTSCPPTRAGPLDQLQISALPAHPISSRRSPPGTGSAAGLQNRQSDAPTGCCGRRERQSDQVCELA
jgi:hypothetical protein